VGVAGSNPVVRSRSEALSADPGTPTGDTLGDGQAGEGEESQEPLDVFTACMWELLRYRLAVQRQMARVKEATEHVRAERQRIDDDEYELVFAPSMSMEAFTQQLQMIRHRDTPFVWGRDHALRGCHLGCSQRHRRHSLREGLRRLRHVGDRG
jgi:hypothetical protein